MKILPLIVLILVGSPILFEATPAQTAPPPSAKVPVKIELVAETKPGSGVYEVLDAAPIFYADSGVGRGQPRFLTMENPKGVFLRLPADLEAGKVGVIEADIGGPQAHFRGKLVETAADSGVFTDEKQIVTLRLPAGTFTSKDEQQALVSVELTGETLGLHEVHLMMRYEASRYSATAKGVFLSPVLFAEIRFKQPYTATEINHLQAVLHLAFTNHETGGTTGLINALTPGAHDPKKDKLEFSETAAGSLTFKSPNSPMTLLVKKYTGTDPSRLDSLDATFYPEGKEANLFPLTLTETNPKSNVFTADATLGKKPEDSQGTDVPPDDPEASGHGVFRLRVKDGGPGPLQVVVKTEVNEVKVTLESSPADRSCLLSGKLIMVPVIATGNTRFKTIQTLYVQGAGGGSLHFPSGRKSVEAGSRGGYREPDQDPAAKSQGCQGPL